MRKAFATRAHVAAHAAARTDARQADPGVGSEGGGRHGLLCEQQCVDGGLEGHRHGGVILIATGGRAARRTRQAEITQISQAQVPLMRSCRRSFTCFHGWRTPYGRQLAALVAAPGAGLVEAHALLLHVQELAGPHLHRRHRRAQGGADRAGACARNGAVDML